MPPPLDPEPEPVPEPEPELEVMPLVAAVADPLAVLGMGIGIGIGMRSENIDGPATGGGVKQRAKTDWGGAGRSEKVRGRIRQSETKA